MPFKLTITCDECGETTISNDIYADDSIKYACELLSWKIINFPKNCNGTPDRQYFLCKNCSTENLYKKLHKKCSKKGSHKGAILYCKKRKKYYCEWHFGDEYGS